MPVNEQKCREILEQRYRLAEDSFIKKIRLRVPFNEENAFEKIFLSSTQAYREVLLGCILARIMDDSIDIHLPYVNMGANAFSGRSLDERVVNPFLHEKSIPCSRGPYLSVFRRNVKFNEATRQGLKDKEGYDALITLIDIVSREMDQEVLLDTLTYVLYRFIVLREQANIQLVRLERISLSRYEKLVHGLLNRQSGGVFPLILVVSMLEAISERFSIPWEISYQGINEADRASGAGGDITMMGPWGQEGPWASAVG